MTVNISVGTRGALLVKSTFNNYDACLNTYVGCQFGCTYCYVRHYIRDEDHEWGDFVRVRAHVEERLPQELNKGYIKVATGKIKDQNTGKSKQLFTLLPIQDTRLVMGTMTDNYQPAEAKHKITQTALKIITEHTNQFKKVGIFTRSPMVLRDIELIKKLPKARVHFTVTPFAPEILHKIEPISPLTASRFNVLNELNAAGIRTHANVSPVIPVISDEFVDEFAERLAAAKVNEFFVDPMQAYKNSFDSFRNAMQDQTELWNKVEAIMTNKEAYQAWKDAYKQKWIVAWRKYGVNLPDTLPIWSDHENNVWVDMRTDTPMSRRHYSTD